jgi:glutamate synthase domain-containing protein 3
MSRAWITATEQKNEQYEHLLRKYRERFPDADKNQLIKKFNSLRTNFRKGLKRIKGSIHGVIIFSSSSNDVASSHRKF